jgi:metal-responsive CopG/Arc/MetJ family transcriptional regulator
MAIMKFEEYQEKFNEFLNEEKTNKIEDEEYRADIVNNKNDVYMFNMNIYEKGDVEDVLVSKVHVEYNEDFDVVEIEVIKGKKIKLAELEKKLDKSLKQYQQYYETSYWDIIPHIYFNKS